MVNELITSPGNRKPRKLKPRQHAPKDQLVELDESHNKQCMLCMQKDISEKKYGTLYQFNDVIVHYFCIVSTITYYLSVLC